MKKTTLTLALLGVLSTPLANAADGKVLSQQALPPEAQAAVEDVMPEVVSWRRDIHAHPELGNREFRTSKLVADHLKKLGMEVHTGVAHTGVVGILRGNDASGPVVALRADMDALPVTEETGLPFASRVTTTYNGEKVGVAHACGHDTHVAMLMGVAQVLASMRDELPGTVKFIFQPAEEGAPEGEEGGADLMLREGAFENPRPDVVFGLHAMPLPVGTIAVRSGGILASSDEFTITVHGQQTHGAMPWAGVDPVVVASQIVLGLQMIPARQLDVTRTPSIVTVGAIHGGVRANIIPGEVKMVGTVRTFAPDTRQQIHKRLTHTAQRIAESAGATAEVKFDSGYPATINDLELTAEMTPTLKRVAGEGFTRASRKTASEDFAYFAQEVPSMFFFLGVAPDDPSKVYPNHSPKFEANERAFPLGVTAMTALTLDYLQKR